MKRKYTIRKYDGDDIYSWAVFKSQDVKGMGNIIFYGDAKPIMCGLDRHSARCERNNLENDGQRVEPKIPNWNKS